MPLTIHPVGTPPSQAAARVLFIHGLDGDPRGTWTNSAGGFWPQWLVDLFPDVAVFTVEYGAGLTSFQRDPGLTVGERARTILDLLAVNGLMDGTPIILIVHSMGGLIVKQMLRISREAHGHPDDDQQRLGRFWSDVRGILFLATPHMGSRLASWLVKLPLLTSASVESLVYGSQTQLDQHNWYATHVLQAQPRQIVTKVYYETRRTFLAWIVPRESANMSGAETVGTDEDHSTIAKPRSRDSPVFRGAVQFLCRALKLPEKHERALLQGLASQVAEPPTRAPSPATRRLWPMVAAATGIAALAVAALAYKDPEPPGVYGTTSAGAQPPAADRVSLYKKPPGGSLSRLEPGGKLQEGDELMLEIELREPSFVTVYERHPDGSLEHLYPVSGEESAMHLPGAPVRVPATPDLFHLDAHHVGENVITVSLIRPDGGHRPAGAHPKAFAEEAYRGLKRKHADPWLQVGAHKVMALPYTHVEAPMK